jgi:hypothetical protein
MTAVYASGLTEAQPLGGTSLGSVLPVFVPFAAGSPHGVTLVDVIDADFHTPQIPFGEMAVELSV